MANQFGTLPKLTNLTKELTMNQLTIDLINQHIEANPSATFFELLDLVLDNGYRIVPDWEIINAEAFLGQVVTDLVEYHDYTESHALEVAPDLAETLVSAIWDEYSSVLEQES